MPLGAPSSLYDRYTVRWYPPDWAYRGLGYLVAVAIPADIDLALTPLVHKTLPAGPYAAFRHAGERDELSLLLDYVYHTWLPNADRSIAASFVLERHEADASVLFFPLKP